MPVNLETILERATSGQNLEEARIFRPSWFYSMSKDPFWVWCQHHAPVHERLNEETLFDRYLTEQGSVWEDQYVEATFPDAYKVEARWGLEGLRQTVSAMLAGESAVRGGALWLLGEDVYGEADVLVRCDDHPSDLGDFHYRVKEVKNSKAAQLHHQLQAGVYTWILGELQGYRPESFDIVLREGEGEQTVDYETVVIPMREQLDQWRKIRDGQLVIVPSAYDTTISPWRKYANRLVEERGDVSLLPGVGLKTAAKLRERGISSMSEILALGPDGCVKEFSNDHHYYHALARQKGKPVFRPGESETIMRRKRLVYFDVEDTSTLSGEVVTRAHTYMVGVATPDETVHIWKAHGEDDEARMWSNFIDWLGDPSEVALYCWTMYEAKKLQQAAADHPLLAGRLAGAEAALIDLKEEIKHRPYFPVTSYSIKSVAPACGFEWSQDDVDGRSAQLLYRDWLTSGDDSIIKKVVQYNREDVLAMLEVDRFAIGMSSGEAATYREP